MENYNNDQLVNLSTNSKEFHTLLSDSVDWVRRNLELEEKDNLLNEIQEIKSEISVLNESILTKPVFALFGISQVGKSYLVKNLLSVDGKRLDIELPSKEKIDFLQSINPKGGGTESTGVVSRFTIDSKFSNPDFPFQVKLLDVKDLILILCDSFFSDIMKLNVYPSIEDFNNHINEFKHTYSNAEFIQNDLTADDVFYLKKYFETYLERINPMANFVSKSMFWLEMATIIDRIDSTKWCKLFEILWTKNKHFSFLFEKLISGLKKLNFSSEIHVSKSAILRDEGKILDVVRVNGIFKPEELTTILLQNNQFLEFDINMLSTLTAEISMPVSHEVAQQKVFLKNTDLLDFPGARSRKPYEEEQIQTEITPELLLRGKIAYLFNKYSSNYEINNLLFCIKNWNNEVKEIPLLINDWITRNVGITSEEREKRIGKNGTNPLFVILTFYNQTMEYNANSDQDDLSEKWEKRFIRLFKEETVTKGNDWDENWTLSEPNFKSFYPLRDFQFSNDIFSGYMNEGYEIRVNPDRLNYYERLKDSFLKFPYIISHFEDPLDAWNYCSTPNQDGSNRIIRDLQPAANNLIKTKNYINKLIDFKKTTLDKLKLYYKTDNISEERDKAILEGIRIQNALKVLFNSNSKFGEFLTKLYLSNTEIYNFIHESYLPAANNHNPTKEEVIIRTYDLEPTKSIVENKEILKEKLMLSSTQEVDEWLLKQNLSLEIVLQNVHITSAKILVDGVIEIWKKRLDPTNFKEYTALGLDLSIIKSINDNLIQTFEIFDIRKELISLFEKKTRLLRVSNDTEEYLASIITSYINDFVSNFGFNFMKDERKNQVMELAKNKNMNIDALMTTSRQLSEQNLCDLFEEDDSNNNLVVTFPAINHFKSFTAKIQLILLSNCGFRKYNIEENELLNDLINRIENLNLEINESL
jgi:hypothetical protein